jgi:Arm DNA-binding domain
MSRITLTNRVLDKLVPDAKPYFLREDSLKGFGVKVNPSGAIKFIAEVWHGGKSTRKILGECPVTTVQNAKSEALKYISQAKTGQLEEATRKEVLLEALFENYVKHGRLSAYL